MVSCSPLHGEDPLYPAFETVWREVKENDPHSNAERDEQLQEHLRSQLYGFARLGIRDVDLLCTLVLNGLRRNAA